MTRRKSADESDSISRLSIAQAMNSRLTERIGALVNANQQLRALVGYLVKLLVMVMQERDQLRKSNGEYDGD